jgi:MFS family permease
MSESPSAVPRDAGRIVLFALATQQTVIAYDTTAIKVALSDVVRDLGTTLTGVQSVISLYALVVASSMITGTWLGARYGHARIFTLGAAIYGSGALVTALSPSLAVMGVGWTLLEGIGAAMIFPAIFSIATLTFSGAERTRALALIGAATAFGGALGPVLGGLITTALSWRASFAMEAAITLVVIVMMRRLAMPKRPPSETSLDYAGVVLSAVGFALIVIGTLLAGPYGLITARQDFGVFGRTVLSAGGISPALVFIVLGFAVLAVFALWEQRRITRGQDPLVRLAVMRERRVRVGSFGLLAQYFANAGTLFLVPVFAQTSLGYTALQSGLTMLPYMLGMIAGALIAGRLLGRGRTSHRTVVMVGFLLAAAGAAIVLILPHNNALQLAPGLAIFGFGLGACSILPDLVQSSAPAEQISDAAGVANSFSYLGQSLGVAITGVVLMSVLTSAFLFEAQRSSVLTVEQQLAVEQAVRRGVQATAVSDAHLTAALNTKDVTGPTASEVLRINRIARGAGLAAAMASVLVALLVGAVLAWRLPRSHHASQPATSDDKAR